MNKNQSILMILFLLVGATLSGCTNKDEISNQMTKANEEQKAAALSTPNNDNKTRVIAGQEDLCQKYTQAIIKTSLGDIKVEFYCDASPLTVNNFMNLAQKGFYNETKFHRVIKDFMIQGGDPNSKDSDLSNDGMGGPGYQFDDEFNDHELTSGSLAMANSGPNTNGSQFFIVTAKATPWLDGRHVNFGSVIEGADIVSAIENSATYTAADNLNDRQKPQDHPKKEIIVKSIELIK